MGDAMNENGIHTAFRVSRTGLFTKWDYLVYFPLTALILTAVVWFFSKWFSLIEMSGLQSVAYCLVSFIFIYNFGISIFRWLLLVLMRKPKPVRTTRKWKVGVATTFVPGLESYEMLEKTVEALIDMKYPHETWVLDEGDDEKVKALCARLGVFHFSRRGKAEYLTDSGTFEKKTKHGNYNAWLHAEGYKRYEIIAGFDPDHVPDINFLEASLAYFDDSSVGYVQFPQAYYNQSAGLIARGAAEETYSYYSATQMSSYAFGFPIVTGSHNIHRTRSLKQVGGFAAHDADDLLITLLYRGTGWQGVYVPEVHARGLTPTDWKSYLTQQLRWARSVLDVKLRAYSKIAGQMPLMTRLMSFLHGFNYVQEGLTGLAAVIFLCFMLMTGVTVRFLSADVMKAYLLVYVLIMACEFYSQKFFLDRRRECGFHWRAGFLRLVKWPYIFFGLIEALMGKKHPYVLTPKVGTNRGKAFMTWPHLVIIGMLMGSWVIGSTLGNEHHPFIKIAAGIVIVASSLALWTETWKFPAPFDIKILQSELGSKTR